MKFHQGISGRKFFFRKFTRKKFAVFNSLHRVVHISALALTYSLIVSTAKVAAQRDTAFTSGIIDLDEVEIIGQKGPAQLTELPRLVTIISANETECAATHSLTDLLQYTGNIDLRQRGKDGIQTDISFRGGSFDQNLILLNGINISDPQTGHLALFLPIEKQAVTRIEILNGPASRVYGANAFSGAVNFVTYPGNANSININSEGGDYGYFRTSLTLNLLTGNMKNLLHYNNAFSNGYMKNTDFKRNSFFYQGVFTNKEDILDLQFGYSDKAFGANSYYTPMYPDQYEENRLSLASIGFRTGNFIKLHTRFYWRRLRDRFELLREGANWYTVTDSISFSNNTENTAYDTVSWYHGHNHHINDVYGAQVTGNFQTLFGKSTVGFHLRADNILSTNIGYDKGIVVPVRGYKGTFYTRSDSRTNFDMYFEQVIDINKIYISGGSLVNWNSYVPDKLNLFPGIDFRYFISGPLSLYGSYNHSLGLPTFTDLTYEDPNNQGNNSLKPYSQNSFEGGLRWLNESLEATIGGFYNYGKGIIDWVWFSDEFKFKPVNIESFTGKGIEITCSYRPNNKSFVRHIVKSILASYTFIDMDKDVTGNISKFFNIRYKASAMLQHEFFPNLMIAENISLSKREGSSFSYDFTDHEFLTRPFQTYVLLDLRISYTWHDFTLFVDGTNILDEKYLDTGSIYQPGRWLSAGIGYAFSGF